MSKLLAIAALALAAMVNVMAEDTPTPARQSIILGGGCFWCVESCFEEVPGVIEAVNRQGHDSGTQYRSIILCTDETQRSAATAAIATAQARLSSPIVTEVVILATTGPARFHRAEDYHQDYFKLHPDQAYCKATIPGKLTKLRKLLDKKE